MSANVRYANGNERRKLREWLRSQGLPCHICGQAIDYSLPAGDPMSFEVDEIVPVSKGGRARAPHLQPEARQQGYRRDRRRGRPADKDEQGLVSARGGGDPLPPEAKARPAA